MPVNIETGIGKTYEEIAAPSVTEDSVIIVSLASEASSPQYVASRTAGVGFEVHGNTGKTINWIVIN